MSEAHEIMHRLEAGRAMLRIDKEWCKTVSQSGIRGVGVLHYPNVHIVRPDPTPTVATSIYTVLVCKKRGSDRMWKTRKTDP
jgi:hypothetical protein